MARLLVRLLGTQEVTLDGIPLIGFESDKERALLAFLVEESQRAHRREKLAGLLWPEHTEAAARSNLRRVLSNLRRLLGDRTPSNLPFFLVTEQSIRFNPSSDTWVDSLIFEKLLKQDRQQPSPLLEEAIRLYKGDFLDGFSIADSPAFEEWMVLSRERYHRLMMETLHRLVEHYKRLGQYERAMELAWRQLDLEPWREKAHQQLIALLAFSGRRSEALAQYIKCRHILAEELDVEPSSETTGLYEQIRDQTLALSLPSPEKHRLSPTHNLPLTSLPFFGREAEIVAIQDYLQDPTCRLLTLVGAGGMGKTRLALEAVIDWISRLRENELDGATLVSLAPLQTAETIVPAIAQVIGIPLSPSREPGQQLMDFLRQKHWLLILDSLEHLPDGAGFVAEFLRTTPQVKILVTSRVRLNLHGEHCLPVAGIQFPERIPEDVQNARTYAAIKLFLDAANRVRPWFEPTDADLVEISSICRLVQGMPLGILLAAAWMGVLPPAEIATEISHGPSFLRADWPDVPQGHRSILAVFDRSWSLLTEREQEVFQALSVFSGGFTRAAAEQVSGVSLQGLRALVDKSFLQITPSGRYEILELLRQYAADKLQSSLEATTDAHNRQCAYFTVALNSWEADLTGARHQLALAEMEAESENIRTSWTWAIDKGQVERLDCAMEGLQHFYWHSGRFREGEVAFGLAANAAAAKARGPGMPGDKLACLRVQVRALAWQSNFLRAMGRRDAAERLQKQCLMILKDSALKGSDTRLERAILTWVMGVTMCMADYEQGRLHFEESFTLFKELNHRWGMAWALNASGNMSMFLGVYGDAWQRLEEGLTVYRALGYMPGIAGSVSRMSCIASMKGRFDEAENLAREGVGVSLESGSQVQWALALLDLGEVLEKAAKLIEAQSVLQQCLALFTNLGYHSYITQAHTDLGSVELHLGHYQESRDHAQMGLALARERGPRFCIAMNLLLLGCLELAQGFPVSAQPLLEESAANFQEAGQRQDTGVALACLAIAKWGQGDTPTAWRHLRHALNIAQESSSVWPIMWVLPAIALLLADGGDTEHAMELYALSSRFPLVVKSRWLADVAGDRLAKLAVTLPDNGIYILQKRGLARDLETTMEELLSNLCL